MPARSTNSGNLVCPKARAQEVSEIIARLKEEGAEESVSHRSSLLPGGSFVELEKGHTLQVKHIQVPPGGRREDKKLYLF
jgi:hypothetical protein